MIERAYLGRRACKRKLWDKWEAALLYNVEVLRSVVAYRAEIMKIDLLSFGDASAKGVATCVYATVQQPSGTNQGLVAARSRLAKQGLRLERITSHMAVNLPEDPSDTLDALPVVDAHSWLDGSFAPFCRVDQRSRRVQAVCIQSRAENEGASGG